MNLKTILNTLMISYIDVLACALDKLFTNNCSVVSLNYYELIRYLEPFMVRQNNLKLLPLLITLTINTGNLIFPKYCKPIFFQKL